MYMNKGQLLCVDQTRHDQIFSPKNRIMGEHSRYDNIFIPSYNKSDLMNSIMLLITPEDAYETRAQYRGLIKHATAKSCSQKSAIEASTEYLITDSFLWSNETGTRPTWWLDYALNNPRRYNETNKGHNIVHYSNTPLPNLLSKDLQ